MAHAPYATVTDLQNWLEDTPPSGAGRQLRRASEVVDELLRCAVYDVDDDTGLPTDADVIAAVRDATCELVSWWQQTADEHGAAASTGPASIGSVTIGGGGAGSAGGPSRVGPQVRAILSNAGLLGHAPMQSW